jgi:16S rRNA (cytosine967-C5)-methyltransferase
MLAVQAMGIREGDNVLDACAAPGGKSVYISELTSATVLASDIHPHRVELIKKYALRMGADNVKAEVRDAAIFDPTLQETFDYILADVPCSGLGVIGKKPDILINYDKRDIANLSITQYNILCNVSRYVKRGGIILYSTCTTLYEENEGVIERFYRENNGYEPAGEEKYINFLPDSKGRDGFFIARIRRK